MGKKKQGNIQKCVLLLKPNTTIPPQGDYMTLAQKSPVKQQGQSPNGKALSSPNNAVLKESYFPKRALMADMDMVDHGGGMLGCGSTTSDTSESTSLRFEDNLWHVQRTFA